MKEYDSFACFGYHQGDVREKENSFDEIWTVNEKTIILVEVERKPKIKKDGWRKI